MSQSYMNIKSFEDACLSLGLSAELPKFQALPAAEQEAMTAHYKLRIIALAINGGWVPSWDNPDERKWYPWFHMDDSDSFYYVTAHYSSSFSRVGGRLSYVSNVAAEYAGVQFLDLYKAYYVIRKGIIEQS